MQEKLIGIVLGGVSYGENDKILTVFTPDKGVVSAKIKGVKKAGAKLKFAAEPFCFAEFIFNVNGSFRTVTGASLIDSFYPVRENLKKYFAGAAALEFTKKFLQEEMVSEELFLTLTATLKSLAYGSENASSLLVKFLIDALKISGYALNLSGCAECETEISGRIFFDYNLGGFLCDNCRNEEGREVNFSTYLSLKRSEKGEELSEEEALKPLRLLDFYISAKAEENIKSLKELIKL